MLRGFSGIINFYFCYFFKNRFSNHFDAESRKNFKKENSITKVREFKMIDKISYVNDSNRLWDKY